MKTRINISETAPAAFNAMLGLEKYLAGTKLDAVHKELIKIRASQINGCAYCLNMHTRDARKMGISEQRIYLLDAWRETELYTPEERAILALTEEITMISKQVSDRIYENAAAVLPESYLADVIMMIVTINGWNRIAIATQLALD